MEIKFRPHHFLCTLCFQGKGYSLGFIKNYKEIVDELKKQGDAALITIVDHTDSICDPCPHRREQRCAMQEKISGLDQAHADTLNIQANDVISWGEAKVRIKKHLSLETFHRICASCSWKKYGICESVLTEFIKDI